MRRTFTGQRPSKLEKISPGLDCKNVNGCIVQVLQDSSLLTLLLGLWTPMIVVVVLVLVLIVHVWSLLASKSGINGGSTWLWHELLEWMLELGIRLEWSGLLIIIGRGLVWLVWTVRVHRSRERLVCLLLECVALVRVLVEGLLIVLILRVLLLRLLILVGYRLVLLGLLVLIA